MLSIHGFLANQKASADKGGNRSNFVFIYYTLKIIKRRNELKKNPLILLTKFETQKVLCN